MDVASLIFREQVVTHDAAVVRQLASEVKVFTPEEVDVAVELVTDRLAKKEASGYFFLFAMSGNDTVGYACFGPIACTVNRFDLYWIVVRADLHNFGIGGIVLRESEKAIARMGGKRIYIETSSQERYEPTRRFYLRNGYSAIAEIESFYNDGDNKLIYLKIL
jgi:ribosomal protein S18 acetylase RimI-like enzyme